MSAVKINRAIKYRAYPTEQQKELLGKTFGCVRYIWNRMLDDAQNFYAATGTFFIPTPAKYKEESPFLKEIDSGALCNAQLDLKGAHAKFLKEPSVGAPKFKSKKKCKVSYTTNNHPVTNKKTGKVTIPVYLGGRTLSMFLRSVI